MTTPARPRLACPLCQGTRFDRQQGRLDSRWGFTTHRMTMMICRRCQFILHFYDAHSIFDFD